MRTLAAIICVAIGMLCRPCAVRADKGVEFFEKKIRPALIAHCYRCHSASAKSIKGKLRLDSRAGWKLGGESGEPAIVPGKPDKSLLILAVRHDKGVSAMPPNGTRLPKSIIDDLTAWVRMGAPDPRKGKDKPAEIAADWNTQYRRRLRWWSLQPVQSRKLPAVRDSQWVRNGVDRFILSALESKGLRPAPVADRRTLARRLSFTLTGLPRTVAAVERFTSDKSPLAYERFVDRLLASPHFGERWARHWMDVVHYSDTHGYEWDVPAKNAWRYRDYLVRAFNADVPYKRLVQEQIAGDLLDPRIDPATGRNESLIGPMFLRLGERRHGDNAAAEGVTQEAVANVVDTIGKAFLGTTLACAQCHDHKLDAVEQRDYYALMGTLMSTRFSVRTLDTIDRNLAVIDELRRTKKKLRTELARLWLRETDGVAKRIRAIPAGQKAAAGFPASLLEFWKRSRTSPVNAAMFAKERERRMAANQKNLHLLADFTRENDGRGWRWDGWGMKHGLVRDGELVVADQGDAALMHVLPAGRFTHVWSQRLAGSLQCPQFDAKTPVTLSVETAGGKFAGWSFIVDRALHSERMQFLKRPLPGWQTLTAGNFDTLEGSVDTLRRRVYLEFATKSLNNYFPPRVGYGGASEAEINDPRSWFGVTRIYRHAPGQSPQDELSRFVPLFADLKNEGDWSRRLAKLLNAAVQRWAVGTCSSGDVRLINEAMQRKLLPNLRKSSPEVARLIDRYRRMEKKIQPDRTVGSAADWNEGRNERIGVRGSYTEFGASAKRGGPRFLRGLRKRAVDLSSGRLELARSIAGDRNPLTARVYVNRVWHYLFGEGLVRTPDDFGHLGERPSHPELLDSLAAQFIRDGWSTKKLVRRLVTSATWRQSSRPDARAVVVDPENRLWHHRPLRRLEAEAIRDAILAVSGRLDPTLYGPPIEPFRTAVDPMKRLVKGPLDGRGRRSLYIEMTLMEPPRFLALFNQPIPKQTVGRRDVTNVPDQALALLNDPFVIAMADHWSQRLLMDKSRSPHERAARMFAAALARMPTPEETERLLRLVRRSAALRGESKTPLLNCKRAWQDAAHALFNLKEFIYVP